MRLSALANVLSMSKGTAGRVLLMFAVLMVPPLGVLLGTERVTSTGEVRGTRDSGSVMVPMRTCVWCHPPVGGAGESPEWSTLVASNSTGFRAFPSVEDAWFSGALSNSALCLSCHDGSIRPRLRVRYSGRSDGLPAAHPVGVAYPVGSDRYRKEPVRPGRTESRGPRLFGPLKTVECISCHDPHGQEKYFLRLALNESSEICLDCHRK